MPKLGRPQIISCDEAGFTGNRLLDIQQPYFAYGSTNVSPDEAVDIIENIKHKYKTPNGELKCSRLLKSNRGRKAVLDLLQQINGRYITTIYDKKLCLGAKVFEYIYEPVLQHNNKIFYDNDLHRFLAMFIYMLIKSQAKGVDIFIEEFEKFMRSLNPADSPILFGNEDLEKFDVLLHPIIQFARGYNAIIARETRSLEETVDTGKWVLDLSLAAVTDHLRLWADRHSILEVVCDDSKPLRALANVYDVMINRPESTHMNMFGKNYRITWNMSKPIVFVDSKNHAAVQLADIVAGTTVAVARKKMEKTLIHHGKLISEHLSPYCIMPDTDYIDPSSPNSKISEAVIIELANRAQNNEDPIDGMDYFYHEANRMISTF